MAVAVGSGLLNKRKKRQKERGKKERRKEGGKDYFVMRSIRVQEYCALLFQKES